MSTQILNLQTLYECEVTQGIMRDVIFAGTAFRHSAVDWAEVQSPMLRCILMLDFLIVSLTYGPCLFFERLLQRLDFLAQVAQFLLYPAFPSNLLCRGENIRPIRFIHVLHQGVDGRAQHSRLVGRV